MTKTMQAVIFLLVGAAAGFALATGAPDHHHAVFENEHVRVLDVRIAPGDTVPYHQHTMPSVVITFESADLVFRDLSGETVKKVQRRKDDTRPHIETRKPAPAPQQVTNVGETELRALRIELKG